MSGCWHSATWHERYAPAPDQLGQLYFRERDCELELESSDGLHDGEACIDAARLVMDHFPNERWLIERASRNVKRACERSERLCRIAPIFKGVDGL